MNPQGQIDTVENFMNAEGKTEKELKDEGYIQLSDEELELIKDLPEEDRMKVITAKRYEDVRKAAIGAHAAERRLSMNIDKKKLKKKRKMAKNSRKKNRK